MRSRFVNTSLSSCVWFFVVVRVCVCVCSVVRPSNGCKNPYESITITTSLKVCMRLCGMIVGERGVVILVGGQFGWVCCASSARRSRPLCVCVCVWCVSLGVGGGGGGGGLCRRYERGCWCGCLVGEVGGAVLVIWVGGFGCGTGHDRLSIPHKDTHAHTYTYIHT
jgi:hypothetical protein